MQNELFNQLLSENQLGVLLEQGGTNLTKAQLAKVREAAKETANMTLEEVQRNADILRGIRMGSGGRESEVMNNYTESLQQKFEPQRVAKAMTGNSKLKGKTDDKMEEEPEEEPYDKRKDPSISKVPPNTHMKLRKGDSEADILAKMLNMMQDNYDKKKVRQLAEDKARSEMDSQRNARHDSLLNLFGHGKTKKEKVESPSEFNWLKVAAVGAIAGLGLFGMKDAQAKFQELHKIKFPSVDDLMETAKVDIDKIKTGEDRPKVDFALDIDDLPFKSEESIAGGTVSKDLIPIMQAVKKGHSDAIITAANDTYHQELKNKPGGYVSGHTQGIDIDVVMNDMSKEGAAKLQKEFTDQNLKAKVTYEPPDLKPGSVNPRGHYHIEALQASKEMVDISKMDKENTPEANTPTKLKLTPKPYTLDKTDKTVKDMQSSTGQAKSPSVVIVNETTNVMSPQVVKKIIKKINQDNWVADGVPPALVKQFGGGTQ